MTYRNPVYAYTISYPSSWHVWGSDPRISQYLSNYDEKAAGDEFPSTGLSAKVEISTFQKSTAESLDHWLHANEADLSPDFKPVDTGVDTPGKPPAVQAGLSISGLPAETLGWPHTTATYIDAGNVIYQVQANWSEGADAQTARKVLATFSIFGKADLARAKIPLANGTGTVQPFGSTSAGLNLPMRVDYAWCCWMSSIGVNGGGVNTWYDHDSSNQADYYCNNSHTRYDGVISSPNWCSTTNSGSCSTSVSCYDGHPGIDFSTDSNTGIPVYAANTGTISTYSDANCGTGLYLSTTVSGYSVKILYCHLSSRIISSGTASRGQEIALSGCTGSGCSGPHLHFAVYRVDISPSHRVDPFGWCGGGSDPDTYDTGYLWSTGSSCSASPSFIGGPLYTVNPGLGGSGWSSSNTDHYGVTYWYNSTSSGTATWSAPTGHGFCYAAEVWIPAGNATNTSAQYVIHFSDGASNQTVTVNQNANTSWYTLIDSYSNGDTIGSITLATASGTLTGAAKAWFECF